MTTQPMSRRRTTAAPAGTPAAPAGPPAETPVATTGWARSIDPSPRSPVERPALGAFRTPVRGHAFAAAPHGAGRPEPGSRARLTREPSNPADPLAVAVWVEQQDTSAWRIGYLDRGVAARVAPRLDAGLRLDVQLDGWVVEPEGRWHRPLLHVTPHHLDRGSPADRGSTRSAGQRGTPGPDARATPDGGAVAREAVGPDTGATPRARRGAEPLWGRPPGVARRVVRSV